MGQEVAEDLVVGIGHRGSCKQIKSCCIFKLCLLQFSIINGELLPPPPTIATVNLPPPPP
ncbi:hypothetical protein HanXRQr2_Chr11g0506911 [Helianthus annuus]|nr:hypothetical protein HanXRQr2_Chr11g0506911 [Helianthus annuus]KAJ0876444.1 hypothetical protein HanPSC8_Chr11g0488541 [Helianthus annuus]